MAARTQQALAPAQRAHDPLLHPRRGSGERAGLVALLLIGAAAIHVAVVAIGFLIGGREHAQRERIEQTVKVEVREPPPPPPPPPEAKKPEPPKPEPIVKKAAATAQGEGAAAARAAQGAAAARGGHQPRLHGRRRRRTGVRHRRHPQRPDRRARRGAEATAGRGAAPRRRNRR